MPSASLARFGNEMPGLLVPLLLGPQYAGLFAICSRVLASPTSMIGATMAKFYLSTIAKLDRAHKKEFLRKTLAFIITVALCITLYVCLLSISKEILSIWLGDVIHQVLPIVMITFPYVLAQVCYRTVSPAYDYLNIQRTRLMCVACACIVPGITFIIAANMGNSENTILGIYSFVRSVGCVLLISIIFTGFIPDNRFNSFRNWLKLSKTKQLDNSV
jgi:O-antigen/teichoic acid export membrane protein